MKKSSVLIITSLVVVLVIASVVVVLQRSNNTSETVFLERYQLDGLSVEEIVYKLDSSKSDPAGLKSSINSEYLILTDDTGEIKLALPEDCFISRLRRTSLKRIHARPTTLPPARVNWSTRK